MLKKYIQFSVRFNTVSIASCEISLSDNKSMYKLNVYIVHTHTMEYYSSLKKERDLAIFYNMNGTEGYFLIKIKQAQKSDIV